jgi:STE24 endopeptidase
VRQVPRLAIVLVVVLLLAPSLSGAGPQAPGPESAPIASSGSGEAFDPVAATEAYLAKVPAADRAKSDAYFEGGYWLQLWGFLYALGVAWIFLGTGLSARIRDRVEKMTRFHPLQVFLYATAYILLSSLLAFPLSLYTDFFREHQYALSNQDFPAWMKDQLTALGVGLLLGGMTIVALYAVFRRAPRRWWIGGTVVALVFFTFFALIFPVYIAPLFNTYTPLKDIRLRDSILSTARGNGIPARDVYQFDASKQSKRVSANVSGLLGTLRISLNDNLLKRCSKPEIEAVVGHEMGHYVLNHVYKGIVFQGIIYLIGFAFLRWSFDAAVRRYGGRWGVRGIADMAGLPLLAALLSVYFFVLTPVDNTLTRTAEAEADIFGLNACRQPDGMAEVALMLAEYRKLSPSPLEEWIFFDHPSGRNRILMAMRWKGEHLHDAAPAPH